MATYPNVAAAFDKVFVSSDLGPRKPERAAFQAIADATGTRLNEMLFFDDSPENVAGAKAAGLQTVLVESPADIRQSLVSIGIL